MNHHTSAPALSRQSGMTLLEILIAMTAGLLLLGGILAVFVTSNQTNRVSDNSARLQENGRRAIELISDAVRMTGFAGCLNYQSLASTITPASILDSTTAISGANDVTGSASTTVTGTDTIIIRSASARGAQVNATDSANHQYKVMNNCQSINQNDQVLIADCNKGYIFTVQNDPGSHCTTGINNEANIEYLSSLSPPTFNPDAFVYGYSVQTLFIRENNGSPSLYRTTATGTKTTTEEMVEGVEDMQVLYGVDTSNDGYADSYVNASGITGTAPLIWANVVSVRIALQVRTLENGTAAAARTYGYGGGTQTDRRLSRTFTSTIAIRNRLP